MVAQPNAPFFGCLTIFQDSKSSFKSHISEGVVAYPNAKGGNMEREIFATGCPHHHQLILLRVIFVCVCKCVRACVLVLGCVQ